LARHHLNFSKALCKFGSSDGAFILRELPASTAIVLKKHFRVEFLKRFKYLLEKSNYKTYCLLRTKPHSTKPLNHDPSSGPANLRTAKKLLEYTSSSF
jgi:hypothetical protein